MHQLNQTATFIWSRLDGCTSSQDLAIAVAEAFEVEPEAAGRDVEALLEQLGTLGLLASE